MKPRGVVRRARVFPFGIAVSAFVLGMAGQAHAQAAPPAEHEETSPDIMNLLAAHGLHDIEHERWNLYGQFTYISSWKLPFSAAYTNANGSINSLVPTAERSFTGSFTLFLGIKLWAGGEAYFVPEVIAERPLSQLRGIGGAIQNFELQKGGTETPQIYRARTFLRQTFNLGGDQVRDASDPLQLAKVTSTRRITLTAGNFTILDVFDRNSVAGDPRRTFFNMAFMTHASWDFPSDARGYSWGGTAELTWDQWTLRLGRITPPRDPNQLSTDFRFWKYYGDQVEVQRSYVVRGRPGAVRLLGYRNRVFTASFNDAVAAFQTDATHNAATCTTFNYGSTNTGAPDLCWARRPNVKVGIGLNIEQTLAPGIGVFLRGMISDGKSEVVAYNPADRSFSIGFVSSGRLWNRGLDVTGLGLGISWISAAHARYLALGGVDGFIGDGYLRQAAEGVAEAFYSVNLLRAFWLAADYQLLWNPGMNADRGPVHILGAKVHAEF